MSEPSHDDVATMEARGLAAALAVAGTQGIPCTQPVVLQRGWNLLVHLAPAPVVARVATLTATVRNARAHFTREAALVTYLAERGAPIASPAPGIAVGPYDHEGVAVTLWSYVAHDPDRPLDAAAAGHGLRALHGALAGYAGELPIFSPLEEVDDMIARTRPQARADAATLARLARLRAQFTPAYEAARAAPQQALHGDAHVKNLLKPPGGPLWNDWEEAVRGPVEWDLACLVNASRTIGPRDVETEAIAAAYGPHDEALLAALLPLRALQATAYGVYVAAQQGVMSERIQARLAYWRAW